MPSRPGVLYMHACVFRVCTDMSKTGQHDSKELRSCRCVFACLPVVCVRACV